MQHKFNLNSSYRLSLAASTSWNSVMPWNYKFIHNSTLCKSVSPPVIYSHLWPNIPHMHARARAHTHTHLPVYVYSAFCRVQWIIKVSEYTIKSISQIYCSLRFIKHTNSNLVKIIFNPLKPELNPICFLLALLAHHFLHISRIRVKSLTLRWLLSYIYGAPILDVSRSHTTTQHSR